MITHALRAGGRLVVGSNLFPGPNGTTTGVFLRCGSVVGLRTGGRRYAVALELPCCVTTSHLKKAAGSTVETSLLTKIRHVTVCI